MFWTSSLRNTATTSCRDGDMTVSSAKFYRMRGSLSSGEYPLFTSGQDLSDYLVHSANVAYAKGIQTSLRVPMFIGWDEVNICELDGRFYWIAECREHTTLNGQVLYALQFMGPTSLFRKNDSVKGSWHKLPVNVCPYLKQSISNGVMGTSRRVLFLDMDCPDGEGTTMKAYWVQVTGHESNGEMKRYGFFIPYNTAFDDIYLSQYIAYGASTFYPSFDMLCTNPSGIFGLTAEQIDDVSISKRCPYKVKKIASGTYGSYGEIFYLRLLDSSNNEITAQHTGQFSTYYDIDLCYQVSSSPAVNEQTVTLNLSDLERAVSDIEIKDWNRNPVLSIPASRSGTVTIKARMRADMSGIYTVIDVFDSQITIPEGKLPYFGSSFETYKAFSMSIDRQIMENAIRNAQYNKETSQQIAMINTASQALTGAAMGALTGNPVTAVAGAMGGAIGGATSFFESDRAYELSLRTAQQNRELSQRQAENQPSSGYNVAYGLIYSYLNEHSPLCVEIIQPINAVDSAYYAAWCDQYGYPAEGVSTEGITEGFWQGNLISTSYAESGMYWDECNRTFMEGFRFIAQTDIPPSLTHSLYITFDTSAITPPIDATLYDADDNVIYDGSIASSGSWLVNGLADGTYHIGTDDEDIYFYPSEFTLNGGNAQYACVVSDNSIPPAPTYTVNITWDHKLVSENVTVNILDSDNTQVYSGTVKTTSDVWTVGGLAEGTYHFTVNNSNFSLTPWIFDVDAAHDPDHDYVVELYPYISYTPSSPYTVQIGAYNSTDGTTNRTVQLVFRKYDHDVDTGQLLSFTNPFTSQTVTSMTFYPGDGAGSINVSVPAGYQVYPVFRYNNQDIEPGNDVSYSPGVPPWDQTLNYPYLSGSMTLYY